MVADAERRGSKITVDGDPRITRSGRFLRKYKIDELPQLLNVLAGDMSLVGPRPEVPEYVRHYPEDKRIVVQSIRPGITDPASLEFRNEEILLGASANPEALYLEAILPRKLALYCAYASASTVRTDIVIIFRTIAAVLAGEKSPNQAAR